MHPRFADFFDVVGSGNSADRLSEWYSRWSASTSYCARRGGHDDIDVVLTLKAFLDDFHVEQAQEAAAEAKVERLRDLGFVDQRRTVEL